VQTGYQGEGVSKKTGKPKRSTSAQSNSDNLRQDEKRPIATPGGQAAGNSYHRAIWISVALAVVTLAVYGQVIHHQFISLDDDLYISNNPLVTKGLSLEGVKWAFTTFHAANYHPLTWLSHMLDSQLFGLAAGRHLLINVLLHVFNTLLLYLIFRRMTGADWSSAIIAALFALHPLHVESVAWAAERKDTLSTFFGLLTLLAYVRYTESVSWKRYAQVALTLALGLMAKPMLVTLPFALLLLDYWPLKRLRWNPAEGVKRLPQALLPLIREKLLLFAVVAASMVVTYVAQSRGGAVQTLVGEPLSLRLGNALVSYAKYLLLTFWPGGLGVYYPFSPAKLFGWQIALAFLLLASITLLAVRQAARRPYLLVGWLWFLGTLVPVIGLVQVGGQALADRYHYLPSIGLFMALVFTAADFLASKRIPRAAIITGAAAWLLILGARTWVQVGLWRDSQTLFTHTLSVTSDNLVIEYNLGHVLGQQGKLDEAVRHFAEAIRINPNYYDALFNMGVTLANQGKFAEALEYYDQALRVEPNSGKAYMEKGLVLAKQGKMNDASPLLYKALELAPDNADVRTNLGLVLLYQGKFQEAGEQLNEALRLNPNSAEAHNNMGLVFLAQGKPEQSINWFSTALRLKPQLANAQENLKRAQAQINARQK
jgi:tetratricopeptide (TPR) repeat protein